MDISRILARCAGLRERDVGYAGLKDRHAETTQWFSLWLPGRTEPDFGDLPDGCEILRKCWHAQKIRTGMLAGNRFEIRVTSINDKADIERRLVAIQRRGVPAYFGRQRFGYNGGNLDLLAGFSRQGRGARRKARRFGLSAIRSALFNGFLQARVTDGSWDEPLQGEIVQLGDGGRFSSVIDETGTAIPTGLLWGIGTNAASGEAREVEERWFSRFPGATSLLETIGVRMQRRPLVLRPRGLTWNLSNDALEMQFELPRGGFATSVIDSILRAEDPTRRD